MADLTLQFGELGSSSARDLRLRVGFDAGLTGDEERSIGLLIVPASAPPLDKFAAFDGIVEVFQITVSCE